MINNLIDSHTHLEMSNLRTLLRNLLCTIQGYRTNDFHSRNDVKSSMLGCDSLLLLLKKPSKPWKQLHDLFENVHDILNIQPGIS